MDIVGCKHHLETHKMYSATVIGQRKKTLHVNDQAALIDIFVLVMNGLTAKPHGPLRVIQPLIRGIAE